jgi:peptidase inhibitor family I36
MNRVLKFGLAGVSAIAGVVVAAPPAAQAAPPSDCPQTFFCVWRNTGFSGGIYKHSGTDTNWFDNNFSGTTVSVANDDSSWFNNGVHAGGIPDYAKVWDNRYTLGDMTICLRYGTGFSSKAISNDRGERHSWDTSCAN